MATIPRERLDRVEEWYLAGTDERQIQRAVVEAYGVTRRAARRYLQRVKAKLAAQAQAADPDVARLRVEALLLNAYRTAQVGSVMHGPDSKAMVQAAKALAEVQGLLVKNVHHSGSVSVDPDALLRDLHALAGELGGSAAADPGADPAAPAGALTGAASEPGEPPEGD